MEGTEMTTGETVKRLREELALSQKDLADKAGVSANTIWKVETGQGRVFPSTIRKLAVALEVDVRRLTTDGSTPINGAAALPGADDGS